MTIRLSPQNPGNPSVRELVRRIDLFVKTYNKDASPEVDPGSWTGSDVKRCEVKHKNQPNSGDGLG
jgi:hypothetical protein